MRLRAGRPDLGRYRDLFAVPEAGAGSAVGVRFAGVSTLLLDDGESALLTDGFFSRPGMARVVLGRIAPDEARVSACLERLLPSGRAPRLEAVLPVHSHFDHALDSAEVARRTGADLVGGTSTANIGRGAGLPEERIATVVSGDTWQRGPWTVTMTASEHCPPDRYPGTIEAPVVPPARTSAYRCGEAWSILVEHASGRSALVQGSAGFVPGSLAGQHADVAYLGVGQLGIQPESYLEEYWSETVRTVGAGRVVLIHWDDFFRPLPMTPDDPPLRALPYVGDDLDVTMRTLGRLAAADGVGLWLPTVWRREDPWLS